MNLTKMTMKSRPLALLQTVVVVVENATLEPTTTVVFEEEQQPLAPQQQVVVPVAVGTWIGWVEAVVGQQQQRG